MDNSFYTETSSDEFPSDSSSDEENVDGCTTWRPVSSSLNQDEGTSEQRRNLFSKLLNRENFGHFSGNPRSQHTQRAFSQVPNRLTFCLKDIIPYCYLHGHMFMGLSACGQFLLSYKVCFNETAAGDDYNYNFNIGYKYTLYFWIYRPHQPLGKFFKICLFDDHGVDNLKLVTMTQWMTNPGVLIVHGAADNENEDSYITIVKVPKLGCADCKKLREFDLDGFFRCDALCIKCNLTIHTKYSTNESDPKFNPYVNLICPERVIIVANGFVHMLHVELETPAPQNNQSSMSRPVPSEILASMMSAQPVPQELPKPKLPSPAVVGCDNKNNIIARIIADFSDIENETQLALHSAESRKHKNFDELVFTCNLSQDSSTSAGVSSQSSTNSSVSAQTKVNLLNHRGNRNHRIVTKSYRNGITTVDLQAASSSANSTDKAASAYEFSEDTEKCEKIGTFRKRRLADKKYEFSEDNSENIVPFTKVRHTSQLRPSPNRLHRSSSHFHSPSVSPSSSHSYETTSHFHRASPSQGFRSPCGSPVGGGIMRSPSKHNPPPLPPPLSPLQVSVTKRNFEIGNISPTTAPFLSPRREEFKVFEVPLSGIIEHEKPPVCTKKFKRRFVEEDDAASVITSEEDDCISPGYHTSLPVEVHGSCYSDMQMISQLSYQKLKCASVVITQHSLDLETFTYYVISILCHKNGKTYELFYDLACELINVCPRSNVAYCVLMAHFTARDSPPNFSQKCLNCSRKIDCLMHRNQFECRILFSWSMETGRWEVLDYGEMKKFSGPYARPLSSSSSSSKTELNGLNRIAKSLANEISASMGELADYSHYIRVLESNVDKSKTSLVDLDNMIEFRLKKPRLATAFD